MAPIQETISMRPKTGLVWYKELDPRVLLVKNVFALSCPFLEVWGTAVFQASTPRSHIPARFSTFLQLLARWHAWLVLSQLAWVQKKKKTKELERSALDTNLKEWKKQRSGPACFLVRWRRGGNAARSLRGGWTADTNLSNMLARGHRGAAKPLAFILREAGSGSHLD